MNAKKFHVGIVGYGAAARAHIDAINVSSLAQVTAVCSARKLDAAELSARHGSPLAVISDLNAMLADKHLNVVSVCGYPQYHARHAIAAARAGKHVIVETPIAMSWEECLTVEHAIRDAKVKSCVCFECRFSKQFQTTKAIIDQGLLGRIHYGEVDYYHGLGPWYDQYRWNVRKEAGGSSLLLAGCHALDALLLCMGHDVEAVSCYSAHSAQPHFAKYEFPTSSVTILKFRDGRVGKVASVIDCLQPNYFHVHLVGSEGSLLDNKFYSARLGGLEKGAWSELSFKLLDSAESSEHAYQAQFEAFFTALDAGFDMPLTSLSDALRTHDVMFHADVSAERHAQKKQAGAR